MTSTELYRAGRLREAIDAQVAEVKANPGDQARRTFLFELLAFAGELDRARRQIDALTAEQPDLAEAVRGYRLLLDSEAARRKVFDEGVAPEFLGTPGEHMTMRVEAAGMLRLGRRDEAAALLARAEEATPPVSGTLNGKHFASLRDADDLLSGVLEVMAMGKYFWVGLEQVASVAMNAPRFPRDLLYAPARLELATETGEVFLPALYPGSWRHEDEQVRLGRVTDWVTGGAEAGAVLGVGARVFLVDDDATPLLEWRELVCDEPAAPAPEET